MPRHALKIEYLGTPFVGWQRQRNLPSVQATVETALSQLEQREHTIVAAGRTDAGVHALGQVVHCDLGRKWDPFRLSEALNFHLRPNPVSILAVGHVANDWNARFNATEREYLFRVLVRRAPATQERNLVWQIGHDLDVSAMQKAAGFLVGRHDFTTFRASICQARTPVKTMDRIHITRIQGLTGPEIRFCFRARSFLQHQVRSIVGTLERVGAGAWQPENVAEALEARNRSACGPVSPPHGLYLARVGYTTDPFEFGFGQ